MNVTFSCPGCQQAARAGRCAGRCDPGVSGLPAVRSRSRPTRSTASSLRRCLVCPSTDLFVRKDFPQRLGVAIVVVGIVGSSIAWGYSLHDRDVCHPVCHGAGRRGAVPDRSRRPDVLPLRRAISRWPKAWPGTARSTWRPTSAIANRRPAWPGRLAERSRLADARAGRRLSPADVRPAANASLTSARESRLPWIDMDPSGNESRTTCADSSKATSAATTFSCSSMPATPASTRSSRWPSSARGRWPTSWPRSSTPPRTTCRSTPAGPAPGWPANRSGPGLVLDFSRYMRRVLDADDDTRAHSAGRRARAAQRVSAAAGPAVRPRPGHEQRHDDGQRDRDRRRRQPLAQVRLGPAARAAACKSCWPTARCWKSAASRSTSIGPIPNRAAASWSRRWPIC